VGLLVGAMSAAGLDVHVTDAAGCSAAQLAACKGHVEVVARLLESGKTREVGRGRRGGPQRALWCRGLHPRRLLRREAAPAPRAPLAPRALHTTHHKHATTLTLPHLVPAAQVKGLTALHLAAQNGLDQVAAQLLACAGCDVNCRDAEGLAPLHWAAARGAAALCSRLVQVRF
jgi:hypothetical protein